jgi:uridine kinase
MKICFIICGQPRSINLVIDNIEKLFYNHEIYFNICLTNNYKNYEKEYLNISFDLNNIKNNNNLQQLLLINDYDTFNFRNCINYTNKINKMLYLIKPNFNLYILIRSDLIFNSIDFLTNIINDDCYYLATKTNTKLTMNINEKLNDNIIITKNFDLLFKLIKLYEYCKLNNNYLEVNLYNFIKTTNILYNIIDINYNLLLSKCNIIAISGDSGSGKTTLMEHISKLFNNNFLKFETDRYHKWERGDENYFQYTHLNPMANNLNKMNLDIYSLKIGNDIYTVDYDHSTGKFTQEQKIESKENIFLCGLHTLYNDTTNKIIDIKIFMDTDRKLIRQFKITRDVEQRGYPLEKVLKQIELRENDYLTFIDSQKENADIIINFFEKENKILCNIFIKNIVFINKILLLSNFENMLYDNNILTIVVKDHFYENINDIIYKLINE